MSAAKDLHCRTEANACRFFASLRVTANRAQQDSAISSRLLGYRCAGAPGPRFFSLGLREPRGSVRFGWGGRFLRAARLSFFRSALSLVLLVFMPLLSRTIAKSIHHREHRAHRELCHSDRSKSSSWF